MVKWAMELSATTLGKSLENFAKGWKSDSGVIVDAEMVGWGSAADFETYSLKQLDVVKIFPMAN